MTIRTPLHTCRICGSTNDATSDPRGQATPKAGDLTICIQCGHLTTFNEDLTQRDLTPEEHAQLPDDVLYQIRLIERARLRALRGVRP